MLCVCHITPTEPFCLQFTCLLSGRATTMSGKTARPWVITILWSSMTWEFLKFTSLFFAKCKFWSIWISNDSLILIRLKKCIVLDLLFKAYCKSTRLNRRFKRKYGVINCRCTNSGTLKWQITGRKITIKYY